MSGYDLTKAGKELQKRIAKNMQDACLLGVRYAKENAPVDEGILRASIDWSMEISEHKISGYIGATEEYAIYVHEGTGIYATDGNGRKTPWTYVVKKGKYKGVHRTRGQKPQPFLRNAILRLKHDYSKILAKGGAGK